MAVPGGYIRVWRSIEHSEVFIDSWLLRLWLWCLLRANFREQKFAGHTIPAGSFVTGSRNGAEALKVSKSRFHRGLQNLKNRDMVFLKTGRAAGHTFTIVTICNWETYQGSDIDERDRERDESGTGSGTRAGQERDKSGTYRRRKRMKEGKEGGEETRPHRPTVEDVRQYCQERGNDIQPEQFVDHYEANGWKQANGNRIVDWKAAVRTWERNQIKSGRKPASKIGTQADMANYSPDGGLQSG